MKRLIPLLSCALFCSFTLHAIEVGETMPAIDAAKWYSEPKILPPQGLTAIVLLDITADNAVNTLRMLESIETDAPKVELAAIAMNPLKIVDAVVQSNGPFQLALAADNNLKSRMLFAKTESLFPYAVLAKDGKVVWTGHPTELEAVTQKVARGEFSASKQRDIEAIRQELQMAIQSGLPDVIASSADKILKIAPDDKIAIQAKLFAFNSKGQSQQALKFLGELCEKNPKDAKLRLMQLDFLLNGNNMQQYKDTVKKAFGDFSADKHLIYLTAFVLENSPYGIMDPVTMRTYAQKSYDMMKNQKTPLAAVAREVLARIRAETGDPASAIRLQEEALAIRKGGRLEQVATERLAYYKKLQALKSAVK